MSGGPTGGTPGGAAPSGGSAAPGGTAPTPSSAPAPSASPSVRTPPATRSTSREAANTDTPSAVFDLGPDTEYDIDLPETFGQPAPQAPTPAAPPSPAQAQPSAETPPTGQPTPSPETPPSDGSPQGSQQDASRPATIGEMLSAAGEHHDQIVDALAQTVFGLTPAEVEGLEADSIGTLPKVFARAYLKSQTSALQMIQQLVPGLIQDQVHRMFQMARAEDSFYGSFPELSDKKYRADIMTAAKAIRQINPNMANDQLLQMAGNMVMQMHKLQRASPGSSPAGASPAQQPFAPASNGTIVAQQPQPAADDFFSILSRTDDYGG